MRDPGVVQEVERFVGWLRMRGYLKRLRQLRAWLPYEVFRCGGVSPLQIGIPTKAQRRRNALNGGRLTLFNCRVILNGEQHGVFGIWENGRIRIEGYSPDFCEKHGLTCSRLPEEVVKLIVEVFSSATDNCFQEYLSACRDVRVPIPEVPLQKRFWKPEPGELERIRAVAGR
jgi:hypothetical protein